MDPLCSISLGVSHISFLSISPRTRPQLLRKRGGAPFGRESLELVMGLTRGGREGRGGGSREDSAAMKLKVALMPTLQSGATEANGRQGSGGTGAGQPLE